MSGLGLSVLSWLSTIHDGMEMGIQFFRELESPMAIPKIDTTSLNRLTSEIERTKKFFTKWKREWCLCQCYHLRALKRHYSDFLLARRKFVELHLEESKNLLRRVGFEYLRQQHLPNELERAISDEINALSALKEEIHREQTDPLLECFDSPMYLSPLDEEIDSSINLLKFPLTAAEFHIILQTHASH